MLLVSIFSWQIDAQSIVIGTGTDDSGNTGSDPIDGYFNAFRYQVVYTAAELSASLTPFDEITGLGWSISEDYGGGALLGYTIKIGHTSATNSAAHDASTTEVVKNAFDYDPTATTAGSFDMIAFDTNFVWNGTDNILVEVCSDGQNPFSSPYGQVRGTNVSDGSRRYRVDGGSACGIDTNNVNGHRPNVQFNYIDGTPPSCLPPTGLSAMATGLTTADLSWTAGDTETEWTYEYGVSPYAQGGGGTSGTVMTTPSLSLTGLTEGETYDFYVQANCGGSDSSYITVQWTQPASGETCDAPIVVGALPYTTTDDTANYGDDYENGSSPCSSWYMSGDDVVYSFTPASDGSYNILMSNIGATYSGIHVLDDCVDGSPNCVGFAGNSGTDDRELDVALTMGTTYYIVISTWASPQSTTYTLDITENTCTNATVAYTVVEDCSNSGGFNIEVEISDMGTATDITVSDDQGSPTQAVTMASTVTFGPYVNGTDVVITVTDDNDMTCVQSSSALTQLACPPANDLCSGAVSLTPGLDFDANPVVGTNLGATDSMEMPLPGCAFYDPDDASGFGGDVWYSVTVPADGNLTIQTNANPTGSGGDSGMAVYSGSCGSLTLVECDDDDSPDGAYSQVVIEPADGLANQMVYVRVWEYSGNAELNFQVSAYSATLSTDDIDNIAAFTYYPNPVKNTLTLNAQNNIENVRMYNMLGQEVMNVKPQNVDSELDMSRLDSGAYFVQVTIAGITETVRVIKQ